MARDETVSRWMSRPSAAGRRGLLASVAMVAAVTGLINVVEPLVPAVARPPVSVNLLVLYTPVVVAAAMLRGFWLAAGTALVSVVPFDFFFGAPLHTLGIDDVRAHVTLVTFLATAVVVGVPAVRLRRALRELARLSEQLTESRARIVAAGDEERRRLERNLHDGAQQRLVSLAFELRLAQDTVPSELSTVREDLGRFAEDLMEVLEELREIARGLHPAVLSAGGLKPVGGASAGFGSDRVARSGGGPRWLDRAHQSCGAGHDDAGLASH
jgi:signal transduction histidine kinase